MFIVNHILFQLYRCGQKEYVSKSITFYCVIDGVGDVMLIFDF